MKSGSLITLMCTVKLMQKWQYWILHPAVSFGFLISLFRAVLSMQFCILYQPCYFDILAWFGNNLMQTCEGKGVVYDLKFEVKLSQQQKPGCKPLNQSSSPMPFEHTKRFKHTAYVWVLERNFQGLI